MRVDGVNSRTQQDQQDPIGPDGDDDTLVYRIELHGV